MTLFGREPAVIIGLVVTIVLGIVSTLLGQGFISDAQAGNLNDAVNAIAQLFLLALPLITGILIRGQVTPVKK